MRKRGNLSVSMNDLNDNEFLQPQEQLGGRAFSRDLRIKKLQQRNVKLQQQVIKIERALSGMEEKVQYGIKLPEIKSDVIRKQLENAYKMIKQYEYEIGKRKKHDFEGAYVEQLRKYEKVLKEKQELAEKLRKEVIEVKRQSLDYVKMLKNDHFKKECEDREVTTNADIKWLHEKIKHVELRRNILNGNLEKQQELIQKLERQITAKHDSDKSFIENLRSRIFNSVNAYPTLLDEKDSDEEIQPLEERDELALFDRNPDIYNLLVGEVKLYRKLEKDYEGKIELLSKEKEEAEDRNFKSRNRLVQAEYEIEKIEDHIAQLKKQVNPKLLKPTKMEMIVEEKRRMSNSVKINKPKLTMPHLFKFGEVGEATKAGKRFIDRNAIGKKPTKIVAVTFLEKRDGEHELLGLQATYQVGTTRKKGAYNMLADRALAEEKECALSGTDFVRTIDCLLNEKGIIVGVSMVSAENVVLKGGVMTSNRCPIEMSPNEYPVCLYGCLLPDGVQMLGTEFVSQE